VHVDLYRLDRADLDEIDWAISPHKCWRSRWAERLARDVPGAIAIQIQDTDNNRRTILVG
jgi:tRNA A37 threonylcarbamoyladenosine biosynthesis protein TsaE